MTSLRRAASLTVKTLAAVLLVSALTLLVAPRVLGWELQMVLSGSMAPAFETGAVIATRPLPAEAVQPGDVITFRRAEGPPVTHRVLEVHRTGAALEFATKGDANEDADPARMPASSVAGEVVFDIPHLGYLADFMRKPLGFLLLVLMPGIAFILAEVSSLVRNRGPRPDAAVLT